MPCELTAGEDHPNEVHEEIIDPEVQELRSAICNALIIMVKHACSIVEDETVYLADGDDYLQRMAQGMIYGDESCDNEA
jgi:hypothetical protein